MKDSQPLKKQQRRFYKKKESKFARLRTPLPLSEETKETVIFEQEPETKKEENRPEEQKPVQPTRLWLSAVSATFTSSIRKLSHLKTVKFFKLPERKPKDKKIKIEKGKQGGDSLFKQLETDLQLALIPLILLSILSMLMLLNNHFIKIIADNKMQQVNQEAPLQPFPLAENIIPPKLSAKAAIVMDSDSQVMLFSKNPELRFSMASTTKIMTALTALDHVKNTDVLATKTYGVAGSVIGLVPGEQLTFKDLLYAMLLPSANDAAVAVADNFPGGKDAFIKKMNEKALVLHLADTHFSDPAGLDDDGNFTTVIDLARLGSYAMKNKTFAEVVGTKYKTVSNVYYSNSYQLANLNKLLGKDGVNGIKTGTTEAAGEVLVTSVVAKGHTFIIVVMNSTDRFADTEKLVDFANEKVQYVMPSLPVSN